jgi:hypothetical protein
VNKFWDEIKKSVEDFGKEPEKKEPYIQIGFSGMLCQKPHQNSSNSAQRANSQGSTGTCWCFSRHLTWNLKFNV